MARALDGLGIMKNIHDPQYWRDRAEEARNTAESFDDPRARAEMLEVAAG